MPDEKRRGLVRQFLKELSQEEIRTLLEKQESEENGAKDMK